MDPMDDLYEPDEARPTKRVRLEAPLAITEEVQEEVIDDGDWDDIYGNTATPQKGASPNGGVRLSPEVGENALPGAMQVNIEGQAKSDAPALAIDDEDQIVARREVSSLDEASNKVLEETSQVEVGPPHKDETVDEGHVEANDAEGPHDNGTTNTAQQQNRMNGTTPEVDNGSAQIEHESNTSVLTKPQQDAEFMAAAAAQKKDGNAEWQFDSSDAESSSDSDSDSSSDDSSDSDSGSEGGYEMLDPATAAKMLMAGDGEDGDGDKTKNRTGDHQPRTANEVKEDIVPKPDVVVTEDMKITHLGFVERSIDNLVLVKATTPGEYQVLESGSVLCNEKREVIGAIAETLGRVQEPMYSVAFTNEQEIEDMGLKHGAKIFYVDNHSTFVFTQPLKNMKGTDASNIHDEEVGEDELEFSDDEEEAEYKRLKKAAKREGRGGLSRSAFNEEKAARNFNPPGQDSTFTFANGSDAPQQQYGSGMNYDDEDVQEEFYSPLKRPDNLSQLMASGGPPPMPHRGNFGGRGRGDRGRGDRARGRGDRGKHRGGFDRNNRGDRGGSRQDDRKRGNFSQQDGKRGPAHSFPDRHNNGNNGRANGRKQHYGRPSSNASHSTSPPPPQQQYPPWPPQSQQHHSPPPPSPQTYQFNGYQFQYGNPPPPQQPPAQQPTYYQQPAQSPPASIPAGSYVNPAFFPQQQQQQPPNYTPWPPQQYPQYPQAQQQQAQAAQNNSNLADILRQLGGYQQQQKQR